MILLVWNISELLFSVPTPARLQLLQTLHALLHAALAVNFVVPRAHIDCVTCLLLLSHHQDEVVLGQLCISDLFVKSAARVHIHIYHEPTKVEFLPDLLGVFFTRGSHRHNHHLTG